MKPTLGRVVLYVSKTGNYVMPADVCAVQSSLYRPNVEAGHIPDLDSDTHVHLVVKTPGTPGEDSGDPFIVGDRDKRARPFGGTYQEWNVPYDEQGGPGTWHWPERVGD